MGNDIQVPFFWIFCVEGFFHNIICRYQARPLKGEREHGNSLIMHIARWAPTTRYKWSYNPYKWPKVNEKVG